MRSVNAIKFHRKSGGAKPKDEKGEVGVSMRIRWMIGGGCRPVVRGTRMAHRRSLGCARDDKKERTAVHKEWVLNRGIFKCNLDNS